MWWERRERSGGSCRAHSRSGAHVYPCVDRNDYGPGEGHRYAAPYANACTGSCANCRAYAATYTISLANGSSVTLAFSFPSSYRHAVARPCACDRSYRCADAYPTSRSTASGHAFTGARAHRHAAA